MNTAAKIYIKIDTATIPTIVANKSLLKIYTFIITLKTLDFSRSGMLDYVKHRKEILSAMCISDSTFRTYKQIAIQRGLITPLKNKFIKLKSYKEIHEILQLRTGGQYIKIVPNNQRIEDNIRTEAIRLNLDVQIATVEGKIIKDNECKPGEARQLRLDFSAALIAGFVFNMMICPCPGINPDVTLSQQAMAAMYGCKSQTSGNYWQKRLQHLELLDVEPRKIFTRYDTTHIDMPGFVFVAKGKRRNFVKLRNMLKPFVSAQTSETC